jgi:hypothetical protein
MNHNTRDAVSRRRLGSLALAFGTIAVVCSSLTLIVCVGMPVMRILPDLYPLEYLGLIAVLPLSVPSGVVFSLTAIVLAAIDLASGANPIAKRGLRLALVGLALQVLGLIAVSSLGSYATRVVG